MRRCKVYTKIGRVMGVASAAAMLMVSVALSAGAPVDNFANGQLGEYLISNYENRSEKSDVASRYDGTSSAAWEWDESTKKGSLKLSGNSNGTSKYSWHTGAGTITLTWRHRGTLSLSAQAIRKPNSTNADGGQASTVEIAFSHSATKWSPDIKISKETATVSMGKTGYYWNGTGASATLTATVDDNSYSQKKYSAWDASTTTLTLSNMVFTPYYKVTFQPAAGGSYTYAAGSVIGTVSDTQTEETQPGLATDGTPGTTYTLTATPANGWSFKGWEIDGTFVDTGATTYTLTPTADTTVRPVFQQDSVTLTFKQAAGGKMWLGIPTQENPGEPVEDGSKRQYNTQTDKLTLTAAATEEGYYLTGFDVAGTFVPVTPGGYGEFRTAKDISITAEGDVTPRFVQAITVNFKATEGLAYTVSAALNGTTMLPETRIEGADRALSAPEGSVFTLKAQNSISKKFTQWTRNGSELSTNAEYSTALANGDTIAALATANVVSGSYQVEGSGYDDWEHAMEAAANASNKNVILVKSVKLPATLADNGFSADQTYVKSSGNGVRYILPSGVNLVIPHNDSATKPAGSSADYPHALYSLAGSNTAALLTDAEKFEYVRLTVPQGAEISVQSSSKLVTGGNIGSKDGIAGATNGSETEKYGAIQLDGSIVVENGGILSSCGYIYGSGQITAKSGAKVYQPFVICDFKGGGYTVSAAGNKYAMTPQSSEKLISPFSRYTMQNIQTRLTIHAGASTYGYADLYAASDHHLTTITLVGSLIKLENNAVMHTKYDASQKAKGFDRVGKTEMTIEGGASFGATKLTVSMSMVSDSIETSALVFPVPYNYHIQLNGIGASYSIPYSLALLPGATLETGAGTTLTIGSGSSRFLVYDGLYDHGVPGAEVTSNAVTSKSVPYGNGAQQKEAYTYPITANLTVGGYSGTANLIVNGTLNISGGRFGGLVQAGDSGRIGSVSGTMNCDAQIGLVKYHSIKFLLISVKSYYFAGATTRTLQAQILNKRTGQLETIVAGQTYKGADNSAELKSYSYTLYTHSNGTTEDHTETFTAGQAPITGAWYQKSITYHDGEETLGTDYYMNSDGVTLRDLPAAPDDSYHYDGKWYTDEDCKTEAGAAGTAYDALAANEDIHLYAKRVSNTYTVTVTSATTDSATPVADVSLDGLGTYQLYKDSVTIIAPQVKGFTFKGWYKSGSDYSEAAWNTDLVVKKSLTELLAAGMADDKNVISLVAVYTKNETAADLTLKLDKAPDGVEVSWDSKAQDGTNDTWRVPVGTQVTITVPNNGTNFRYWTNANDKVMSREKTYKFTMVTNTTLTAETSTSNTFVIFQSADERLLKAEAYSDSLNESDIPAAPYRVGYEFKGWKVGSAKATTELDTLKTNINNLSSNATVIVTAAYDEITGAEYTVTATQVVDGVRGEAISGENSFKLGAIATFEAPDVNDKAFRFWASNANGTNILSFSRTYSFRVTQDIDIYAIYGETVTDRPPVVRVDNVLKNGSPQSLTFMIGASIPSDYELVEMGALYTRTEGSGTDAQLRVEKVGTGGVLKAVSKLTQQGGLTDYSYALGFNMTGKLSDTIYLRGYVAVKKTNGADNTIYYYYSGVTSANYNDVNTQQGG